MVPEEKDRHSCYDSKLPYIKCLPCAHLSLQLAVIYIIKTRWILSIWQVRNYKQFVKENTNTLTIKSGGVVLYTSQVQVVIPPLCVLIHTVMLTLSGWRLIAVPFAARQSKMRIVRKVRTSAIKSIGRETSIHRFYFIFNQTLYVFCFYL